MSTKTRRLGVNIDHVATLKRLRDTPYPNLLEAAKLVVKGGADQITVHLREDRRHIVDQDVFLLKDTLKVDLNFEMAATEEMLQIALKLKPHSICIVPEKREERTTEGGLDLTNPSRNQLIEKITKEASAAGILVSYFIEPDAKDVEKSFQMGAKAVELHTGTLCILDQAGKDTSQEWKRVKGAVAKGRELGVLVHAGHGIDYKIASELGSLTDIVEFNIGHAIVCEAVFCGIEEATRKMKTALGI